MPSFARFQAFVDEFSNTIVLLVRASKRHTELGSRENSADHAAAQSMPAQARTPRTMPGLAKPAQPRKAGAAPSSRPSSRPGAGGGRGRGTGARVARHARGAFGRAETPPLPDATPPVAVSLSRREDSPPPPRDSAGLRSPGLRLRSARLRGTPLRGAPQTPRGTACTGRSRQRRAPAGTSRHGPGLGRCGSAVAARKPLGLPAA